MIKRNRHIQKQVNQYAQNNCTEDPQEVLFQNAVVTAERAIITLSELKSKIKAQKSKMTINDLLMLGAEIEMIIDDVSSIILEHHL